MTASERTEPDLSRTADAARELDCLLTIGRIAGRVAHEINNPLAGIQNAFLLVKDAVSPSHPHYAYVGAIEREIRRIAMVTRILAESYSPERDQATGVSIATIVTDAVRFSSQIGGARIELDSQVHEVFAGAAGLLRHTLDQLLDLSVRASMGVEPVTVTVRSTPAGTSMRVRYRDARASVDSSADRYPRGLIAAMGGTMELSQSALGWSEITLLLAPADRPERGG